MDHHESSMQAFFDKVMVRAGHPDRANLQEAVESTLKALGAHLGPNAALFDGLDASVRSLATGPIAADAPAPEAVYAALAARAGMRLGVALELVQSVVAELTAELTPPTRERLRAALPPRWAQLCIDPRPTSHRPGPRRDPTELGQGHTLSTGHPGGSAPLADAKLPPGQRDSIATSDDPHPDRRLASARGVR